MAGREVDSRVARRSYIPTLDGWRAIAIGLVIGAHCVPRLADSGTATGRLLVAVFEHAGLGVDVFFALSGYLICTLLLEEKKLAAGIGLGRFYTRRAFRILPPVVGFLAALAALRSAGVLPDMTGAELVSVATFSRNYWGPGTWYTGHFWSLAVEEHFYLLIPLLLSRLRWRAALVTSAGLVAATVLSRVIDYRYGVVQGWLPWTLPQFRTENRFDALMGGAILALLLQRAPVREWLRSRVSVWSLLGLCVAAGAALWLLPAQPVRRTIVAAVMPWVIAHTVLRPEMVLGAWLEWPLVRWVGRLSYSLYIWQQLFLTPGRWHLGLLQELPWGLGAAVGCAVLSYYLVEKPMIRVGHRLASSPLPAPVVRPRRPVEVFAGSAV